MQTDSQYVPKKSGSWFFILGIVALALFLLSTNLFLGGKSATIDPEDPARDAERVKNLAELKADNEKKLNSYAWVDQAKGSVQIPVQQAMTLVLAKLNSNKPKPAYPVLDNIGKPLPPNVLNPPTVGANDELPENTMTVAADLNVLAAPIETSANNGKDKKSTTQQ